MVPAQYLPSAARQVARGYASDDAFLAALLLALGLLAVVLHLTILGSAPIPELV